MIEVPKGPIPSILQRKAYIWKTEYCTAIKKWKKGEGEKPRPNYNKPEIKTALKRDFHNKCAYCESKISHQQFGDVEHFKPKEKFCNLTYEWDNLLLSCQICNNTKRDKFPLKNKIINPVKENPEPFFSFENIGSLVKIKPNNKRAANSIEIMNLNRDDLSGFRKEHLQSMEVLRLTGLPPPHLLQYVDSSAQFSGMCRFFLR